LSDSRRPPDWRFLAALASIAFVGPLAIHLFMPVMPEVQKAFGISSALVGMTFSVTLVVMAFTTLVCGTLSDRFGRRPVLLAGLAAFVAGSAFSAVATSAAMLVVARIVQAIGAGAAAALNRAIAHDAYGPDRLVKVIAYLTMAYTLGPMFAPIIGGALIDTFGWRSTSWLAMVAGGLIAAAAWRVLHETHTQARRGARSMSLWRSYALPLRHARFWAFVLHSGFSSFSFMAMATASSFLMQDYLGRPATEFGLYFFLFPCGLFLGNFVASRLSGRVAVETMVLTGTIVVVAAVAVQSTLILTGYLAPWVIFVPGGAMTFAQGMAMPNAQSGAMRVAPQAAGTTAGLGVFFQMTLAATGAQVYALIADGTPLPMVVTVVAGTAFTLVVGVAAFAMRRRVARR
jgi:DHA1 family bicyclomycin/chloramphenicol resistance-like MFS transporter